MSRPVQLEGGSYSKGTGQTEYYGLVVFSKMSQQKIMRRPSKIKGGGFLKVSGRVNIIRPAELVRKSVRWPFQNQLAIDRVQSLPRC